VIGPPRVRNEIQELLDELNTILDSKATFPGAESLLDSCSRRTRARRGCAPIS
jgi:hypothetical protein